MSPEYTQDPAAVNSQPTRNSMTREEFLRRVLHSGELTRVAQHLALVIAILADEKGILKASARDLQRVTGWSKTVISDHLAELKVFIDFTLGLGRGKTLFELQGVIEDTLNKAVVAASRTQTPPPSVRQPDTTDLCGRQPDTNSRSVREADANSVRQTDTNRSVHQADTTEDLASTRRTQEKKGLPHTPSKENNQKKEQPPFTPQGGKRDDHSKKSPWNALNPTADGDVSFHDGHLQLLNGARTRWVEKLGGDEQLDLALIEVANYVEPNSSRPLIVQVESQLARRVRDKLDRDARYSSAAGANQKSPMRTYRR